MKKNVVAFSLWGEKSIYWVGSQENIKLVKNYFPDWVCRFYVDKNCNQNLIDTLQGDNVEVVLVESNKTHQNSYFHNGMLWRFEASEDENVDIFLSRDCDSRISEREFLAIKEWLLSDKDFHVMRDHPYHTTPILGGMWGCRNGIMRRIGLSKLISGWSGNERSTYSYGIDQDFLREVIYPLVKETTFEHSEFNISYGNTINKFPSNRIDYEFVGDVFDENNMRHPDYWKIIKNALLR